MEDKGFIFRKKLISDTFSCGKSSCQVFQLEVYMTQKIVS